MAYRRFAAIDVGSFEVEMGIYEISASQGIRLVDNIRHDIALGSDTYRDGVISYELVQELLEVLCDFASIMKSYRCTDYRAYATSALREAKNREVVLDQIRVRSGIEVQVITNAEQRFISCKALAARGEEFERIIADGTAVAEVGYGSTQITCFENGRMTSTQNLNLGTLRLKELLSRINTDRAERELILGEMAYHELETYVRLHQGEKGPKNLILIGDTVRLLYDRVMRHYKNDPEKDQYQNREKFEKGYRYVIGMTDTQISDTFGLSMGNAGLAAPAAILCHCIMEMTGAEKLWIPGTRQIDGIAAEYAFEHKLIRAKHDFDADIVNAVRVIAKRYGEGDSHRDFTVKTALKIFDAMQKGHGLTARDRLLLQIAAMLHHCGRYVNMSRASLTTGDIVKATELVGITSMEHELLANVVRNEENGFAWDGLTMQAAKLTAIVRLASSLDRSAKQKAGEFKVQLDKEEDQLVISTRYAGDMTLERLSFELSKSFFTEIYGIEPVLKQKRKY